MRQLNLFSLIYTIYVVFEFFLKKMKVVKTISIKGFLEPKNDCKETYPEIHRFL